MEDALKLLVKEATEKIFISKLDQAFEPIQPSDVKILFLEAKQQALEIAEKVIQNS